MSEAAASGRLRIWGQVFAVIALAVLGSLAGALSGWLALSPLLAVGLPLLAAHGFLARDGLSWRDLGFLQPIPLRRFIGLTLGATLLIFALNGLVLTPLLRQVNVPPPDPTLLVDVIEGNLVNYLLFLIPITWGSAAFGEELLVRGFLMNRFSRLYGTGAALALQALVFALGHTYQGLGGVIALFAVGVVLGWFYLRAGRNLWPVIAAHGLIDTIGITLVYLGYAQPAAA